MTENAYAVRVGEFSWALERLKHGWRVRRRGWNGKGMWIGIMVPGAHTDMDHPYIYMSTVDGTTIPWLASQADLLAEDWELVED